MQLPMDRRNALRAELVTHLRRDLAAAEQAHRATVAGATHEEAKPENDKDTRALEQSYLARGQAQRVEELRGAVAEVEAMAASGGAGEGRAVQGALVTVDDGGREVAYWIAPHGGGLRLEAGGVQVVTPRSPLGRALVGRGVGDDCEVTIAGKGRTLTILRVE
jgi:transcription elongation GreA/GreB family factor